MSKQIISQLSTAATFMASIAKIAVNAINSTEGGAEAKLAVAEQIEIELASAEQTIAEHIHAARGLIGVRSAAIRAELNDAAMLRVINLLKTGALSIDTLAAQVGVSAPAATAATAAAVAHAAEIKASLPNEIRANLVLQAGYLHAVKFSDPATGAGWSGRGPQPKWLKALCVDGKTIEDFRVSAPAQAPAEADVAAPVAEPVAEAAASFVAEAEEVASAETTGSFDASDFSVEPSVGLDVSSDATIEVVNGLADREISFAAANDDINVMAAEIAETNLSIDLEDEIDVKVRFAA